MSDTPYRIELIVYPDRTIEFKGDAQEIETAKNILLSSSQALARRSGIAEAMKVVEEMRSVEHKKEWWCKKENEYRKDYFSHNDRIFCEDCGSKLELREYDKAVETYLEVDDILQALQEKLDTKGELI